MVMVITKLIIIITVLITIIINIIMNQMGVTPLGLRMLKLFCFSVRVEMHDHIILKIVVLCRALKRRVCSKCVVKSCFRHRDEMYVT